MITLSWDKRFELGHERIDLEHRIFLDLIRAVSEVSEREEDHDRLHRLLIEIKKYAEFHFFSEENIMLDHAYIEYERHRQDHIALMSRLDDRIHAFQTGAIEPEPIVEFLFGWFALHTTQEDKKFAVYLSDALSDSTR